MHLLGVRPGAGEPSSTAAAASSRQALVLSKMGVGQSKVPWLRRSIRSRAELPLRARRSAPANALAPTATTGHYALVVNPEMRILGVHPVDGVEGCFLIESIITDATSQPDFGQMTQPRQDRDQSNWQVAYDEKLLDDAGESVIADLYLTPVDEWPNRARVSFFIHELNTDRPLSTPFGNAAVPSPTPRPARLTMLVYEAP